LEFKVFIVQNPLPDAPRPGFLGDVPAAAGNQLDPDSSTNDLSGEWIENENYFPDDIWDDFYPDTFYAPEVGPDE
jgi:hypothetical protein